MFKLYDLECPKCGLEMEEYLEFDQAKGEITEEVLCENCLTVAMVPKSDNRSRSGSVHSSAGQWNSGNMVG